MMCPNQEHQSPQPTTYIIAVVSRTPPANHLQWCLRGTIMSTWRLVEGLATCVRPLCAITAVSVDVARFCGQRRHPQQRYYEGSSASSRQKRWRGGMRSMRDTYVGDGFQQTTHSNTHVGRNFHRNLRNDSPSSVRSLTPPHNTPVPFPISWSTRHLPASGKLGGAANGANSAFKTLTVPKRQYDVIEFLEMDEANTPPSWASRRLASPFGR
ncbi:hypothetical protein HPB51_011066 [Rhipicephalus microplus]|uniref:Uncharacterized protein n=1 Tax=Rhipicephalus microplus TaxID=6941 RepID=A0A9J6DU73_RHIMP|nr:hypothetical protein HPB51_011066 [Rhipicephalus microplus]